MCGVLGHPLTAEWAAEKGLASGGRELERLLAHARPRVSFGVLDVVPGLSSGDPRPKGSRRWRPAVKAAGGGSGSGSGSGGAGSGDDDDGDGIALPVDAAAIAGGADWQGWLRQSGKAI